jgi:hypothetical protein
VQRTTSGGPTGHALTHDKEGKDDAVWMLAGSRMREASLKKEWTSGQQTNGKRTWSDSFRMGDQPDGSGIRWDEDAGRRSQFRQEWRPEQDKSL